MGPDLDVLICGAGAAGLTLAVDLARRGVCVRLIERLEAPFPGSRGKGVQPRTQEIFEDLGVLDRIAANGGLYPPQRLYDAAGGFTDAAAMEIGPATAGEPYHIPLLAPQFVTEAALRARLTELGGRVEFGRELLALDQDADGVTARISAPGAQEVVRARFLVGADGGRSFVRGALGVGFPGETLGVRAIVADVALVGLERDVWSRFNEGSMERQISFCPLPGTSLHQVQAPIPLEGEVDLTAAGLAALTARRTGRDDIRITDVTWASAFTMSARLADRYRVGRVFLVGDAAHIHPPTGGQGLNTSVQDAYNLAWKLKAALKGCSPSLLDTYEEERRPIAADMLGLAAKLLNEAKEGEMRRGREIHQLDLGYRGLSLSLETPPRAGRLRAGDRAPDAPVRRAAGQATRLFSLFQGPHWTLLGQDARAGDIPARPGLHAHMFGERGDVVDPWGAFREAYGLDAGDFALVRPDGYVGAIVGEGEVGALLAYLDAAGVAAL